MPGQIPQALNQLTSYLQGENARLEKLKKEQDINTTLSQVSKQFESLGPSTTQEDARALFFDTIRVAAQNNATETIPFIQGLYNDTLQYVNTTKALAQDKAFKQALQDRYGIEAGDNLTGEQVGKLFQLEMDTSMNQVIKNKEGTSDLQRYKFTPQGYVKVGEPIRIDSTTLADKYSFELSLTRARARYSGTNNKQKTTYTITKKVGGKLVQVPLSWDPQSGDYFYSIGGKDYQYDPARDQGLGKWESPTLVRARTRKEAESNQEYGFKKMQLDAAPLASILRESGDLPSDVEKELRGLDNPDLNKNAVGTVVGMMGTPTREGDQLLSYIYKIKDDGTRERALAQYNMLKESYNYLQGAEEDLNNFMQKDTTPPENLSLYGALNNQDYGWTRKVIIDGLENNSASKPFIQKAVAVITGQDPEDVTWDDFQNLPMTEQVKIQKKIFNAKKGK